MEENYSFGIVIDCLKDGRKMARHSMNDEWIALSEPTEKAVDEETGEKFEELPYIVKKTINGKLIPWTPTQEDMLAEDWYIVE